MPWSEQWIEFKRKNRLNEEIKKIDHWIDFRIYAQDIFLFLRSPNAAGSGTSGSHSNKDVVLDTVVKYDDNLTLYLQESKSISKMKPEVKEMFMRIYVLNERTYKVSNNWHIKEDLLIEYAKNDETYMLSETIYADYIQLIYQFEKELNDVISIRKKEFQNLVMEQSFLVPEEWKKTNFELSEGCVSRRKRLIIYGSLFLDGFLSKQDFKRITSTLPSGFKYQKHIFNQL